MQSFADIISASKEATILITGCDMYDGYMICREMLKEKGKHFKRVCAGFCHENSLVHMLKKEGADIHKLSLDDTDGIVKVYRNADIVIVVPPINEHRWGESSVGYVFAAKAADVKGLVLCSKINAKEMKHLPALEPLHKMEVAYEQVKDHMKAASLVRCNVHIDVLWLFRHQIAKERKLCLSADAETKFAPLTAMDGAHGLLNMLLHSKHKPGVYEITGPEKLTFKDVAHEVGKAVGKDVEYKEVSHQQVMEYLEHMHEVGKNEIEFICDMLKAVSKKMMDKKTDDLEKLLDKEPMSVKHFLKKNANDFKPRDD
ncbi:hypothetical protein GGI07_004594 [Coemansia sp. Benny D115]|nr:hypothetical protein GGI07_004594 [Coemansia sp. Benny D115]